MGVRFAVRPRGARADFGVVYEFDQARVVIGRSQGADVRLPHPSVSQTHAVVREQGVAYVLVDEGSTNGTRVNGQPVVAGRPKSLRNGDRIEVGLFELVFGSGVAVAEITSTERTTALARRFVRELWAEETAVLPSPRIQVVDGPDAGRVLEIAGSPGRWVVGRGDECQLILADADVSREHLALVSEDDGVTAQDLGSKNGVTVNDRPVRQRRLRDRDEIGLGRTLLVFEDPADAQLRALDEEPDSTLKTPLSREPEPTPNRPADQPSSPALARTAGPDSPDRPRARLGADAIIYVLAGSIFILSLVGLFYLLRG